MSGESNEELHLAAVVAKLTAVGSNAYGLADLPITKPSHYTEVHVMQRYAPPPTVGGVITLTYYRVLLRQVAQDYTNAQWERGKATEALEGSSVTVGGKQSTVITRALSDDPITPDDGWFSGTSEFSYAFSA